MLMKTTKQLLVRCKLTINGIELNKKQGRHALTIKGYKIIVESKIGRSQSMQSVYELHEYDKALECYNRLIMDKTA